MSLSFVHSQLAVKLEATRQRQPRCLNSYLLAFSSSPLRSSYASFTPLSLSLFCNPQSMLRFLVVQGRLVGRCFRKDERKTPPQIFFCVSVLCCAARCCTMETKLVETYLPATYALFAVLGPSIVVHGLALALRSMSTKLDTRSFFHFHAGHAKGSSPFQTLGRACFDDSILQFITPNSDRRD